MIPVDARAEIRFDYQTSVVADKYWEPGLVVSTSDEQFARGAIQSGSLMSVDREDPFGAGSKRAAFPPPLGRNERCWCGSGLKFKRCHGR